MLRERTFINRNWGPQTYARDFRLSDFTGISGSQSTDASVDNIENAGGNESTQYAVLHFAEGNKAKSQFNFNFVTEEMNIPPNAIIDSVSLIPHFTTRGTFGTSASLKFCYRHGSQGGNYTYSNYSTNYTKNSKISYNSSVTKIESVRSLQFWFDFTCGTSGYDDPRIEFYGASLKIDWHINDIQTD